MTQGIAALGSEMFMRINRAVRTFDAFTPDNAPVGEHDLGTLEVDGYVFIFKIDYDDLDLEYASPDPAFLNLSLVTTLLS